MQLTDVAHRRLATQRLVGDPFPDVPSTVRALLAVQSQDFGTAGWSIAQRCDGVTEADFLAAFDAGDMLRTHVLRPTWHLVHPEDLRWLLTLTGPRVHQANGHMYRRLELDPATRDRATEVIVEALDGGHLTRNQLGERLAAEGIEAAGQRLAYIAMHAELEQVICSGPLAGKQHTYALLDDRAPSAGPFDRDEALAELTLRFFASHGPATTADLRAWASLTLTDLRSAIADLGDRLTSLEVAGRTFYLVDSPAPPAPPSPLVRLLQPYDEYLSGASDSNVVHDPEARITVDPLPRFAAMLLVDGHVVGSWRRVVRRDHVTVEVAPLVPLDRDQRSALDTEASLLARYLDVADAEVVLADA